jgi:hypothetical protein
MSKAKPTFKAFLSHRYKSPEANQRFFDVLCEHGNIHFEVDVGLKATNVTRLELFVRNADAFVGIYPFPSEDNGRPTAETALRESRYFRLELDLALRSRRPAIVFIDARYGTAITVPRTTRVLRYDNRQILGAPSNRRDTQLSELAEKFCTDVAAASRTEAAGGEAHAHDRVGIILPGSKGGSSGYSKRQIDKMEEGLAKLSLEAIHVDWNGPVDLRFMNDLASLDWAIVDIGPEACASGLPAFLHGYFIPQMRLLHTDAKRTRSPLESTILAAFDVGYPKDIIRWGDAETLDREFVQRLTTLYEPRKYISTAEDARDYFAGAAKRKEAVFLSYSGRDRELVSGLRTALRKKFQLVFDYRDEGESIIPGRRWIEEVFDKLAASAIGIPILSPIYVASENCRQEANQMAAMEDAGKIRTIPVKIKEGPLDLPGWLQAIQYVRGWEYSTPESLVDKIVSAYDSEKPTNPGLQPPSERLPPDMLSAGSQPAVPQGSPKMAWFEDLPLDFTREETREAEKLLVAVYRTNLDALTLAQDAGLDSTQLNQMAQVKSLVRDILTKARQSDRLVQLLVEVLKDPSQQAIHDKLGRLIAGHEAKVVVAALQRKPSIVTLATLPSSIEVWAAGDKAAQPLASPGLEKLINAAAGFADVAVFRHGLAEAEVRTAQIEIGGKVHGTGFLVGKSLLLTNWHVVQNARANAVARFDHKVLPGGTVAGKGRVVPFAADWLVAQSPHDSPQLELGKEGPPPGTWDFALIRLAEPVASQGIGPQQSAGGDPRGHYDLDGSDYDFENGEPLLIVGHPNGRPMQLSYASPSGAKRIKHLNRVRYHTNTEGGSSGSPVFNRNWRVVALHHAAGPTTLPGEFNLHTRDFNQGIAIAAIVTNLREQLTGQPSLTELGLE